MPAEELDSFDALVWIDRYFAERSRLDYRPTSPGFVLLTHLELVRDGSLSPDGHDSVHSRGNRSRPTKLGVLTRTRYTEFLNYFRDRYLHAGDIEEVFERLLMTNMESQVAVRRALVGEAQDLNNIVFALLLIAHRIRNNLFHGNKGVETLHTQTKLFQVINRLLATFIEDIQPRE